jgi:hypothetical protein
MALGTYSELQTAALDWMERSGQTTQVVDWIALAEARLNRDLGAVETDTTLTGVLSSRRIDISALSIVQPIALFLAEANEDEIKVQIKSDGSFPYLDETGKPGFAAIDGTNIDFNRPLDAAYPFRFRYRQRFALSDASPTNWLLTNHPDIYLAATLMWGAGYNEDWSNGSVWKQTLEEGVPSVRNTIAQSKRGVLTVDKALQGYSRRSYHDLTNHG